MAAILSRKMVNRLSMPYTTKGAAREADGTISAQAPLQLHRMDTAQNVKRLKTHAE